MLCPSCHTQNRDNAKFCKGCGMSFTPEMLGSAASAAHEQSQPVVVDSQPEASKRPQATAVEPEPAPKSEDSSAIEDVDESDDLSLAPTQILTPEQMMAYHTRRWQQELEREQQEGTRTAEGAGPVDIADMPTVQFSSAEDQAAHTSNTSTQGQPDISAQPTIVMAPSLIDANGQSGSAASAEAASSTEKDMAKLVEEAQNEKEVAAPKNAVAIENESSEMATENSPISKDQTPSPKEEEKMDQATPPEGKVEAADQAKQQEQVEAPDFAVLAVGATVGGRYEVTQVVSENADEHVYQVVDHQGYQQCWNCNSQQNAEGDEFCIDCGAELLNAVYTMHEYPAAESANPDMPVLAGTIVNTLLEQGYTYVIEQPQAAQIAFPNGVHLLASCDSDAGNVRRSEPNEDSVFMLMLERVHESIASPAGMFLVADGMGGHDDGQGASRLTVSTIAERIVRDLLTPPLAHENAGEQAPAPDEDALVGIVHGAIQDANTALCKINQRDKTDKGSTLTGFMIVGDLAYIFNVGDSRTYMARDGKLYQLTTDHSLVGQLVAGGLIEPDDVYTHPQRSQIYRSIGDKLNVQIDIFKQQIHPGDILLSCSDGLWEMVRNPQITDILINAPDPQTACTHLIEAANTNGGEDNVSAVIVFVR